VEGCQVKLTNPADLLPPIGSGSSSGDQVHINLSGISQNTDTHFIGITEDKLHRILAEYQQSVVRSRDWMAPFGIFVSLVIALCASTFNDFILEAKYWRLVFVCVASIAAYVTLMSFFSLIRNRPLSLKDLVDTIAGRRSLK
jgi:hypothetical protein